MRSLLPFLSLLLALLSVDARAGIIFIQANSSCGNPTGFLKAVPNGGAPPYTYSWSTGAQTDSIGGLVGGTGEWYVVTVTDALLQVQVDSAQIQDDPQLNVFGITSYIINDYGFSQPQPMHPCPGQCDGGLVVHREFSNGAAPYFVEFDMGSFLFNDDIGNPVFGGFCNGDNVTLTMYDAFGCMGSYTQQIVGPIGNSVSVVQVNGACGGQANGGVELTASSADMVFLTYVEVLDQAQQSVALVYSWELANDTANVTGLAPGNYTVRTHYGPVDPACVEDQPFTVPDLGIICGNVSGRLFIDHDQDCAHDGTDTGVPFRVLTIEPGPEHTITDAAGNYSRNLLPGNFTITTGGTDLLQLCPVDVPAPFTIAGGGSAVVDLADSSTIDLDLEAALYHLPARPGFTSAAWGWVHNLSGQLSGPVTVTMTLDPVFTVVSTYPAPTSVVGNVITWDLPALNSFGQAAVSAGVSLPPDVGLIGTAFTNTLTCTNTFSDADPANNTSVDAGLITGSFDPNDKAVRTSSGLSSDQFILGTDEWLDYTIRFQNTGTDTAFTVVLADTLDPDLDLATLELRMASHLFVPTLSKDRVLRFSFLNIQLPDSNVNEAASHGFVQYRIRPAANAVPGTVVVNAADIYFDFNPPVRTNTTVITLGTNTGLPTMTGALLSVHPNPTEGTALLRFSERTAGPRTISLWTLDGALLQRFNVSGAQTQVTLDLGPYAPGLYRVQSSGADGQENRTVVKR